MSRSRRTAAAAIMAAAALTVPAAASADYSVGKFTAGSGNFQTTSGTDGLRQVGGSLTFSQAGANAPITVNGRLTGLAARTLYVSVPYKDAGCTPLPGITAFPSGTFYTDASGSAVVSGVTVNPTAINPAGDFDVRDTHSVSIRQAVVSAILLPGIPIGTPTVPNVVQPEACDKAPVVG